MKFEVEKLRSGFLLTCDGDQFGCTDTSDVLAEIRAILDVPNELPEPVADEDLAVPDPEPEAEAPPKRKPRKRNSRIPSAAEA